MFENLTKAEAQELRDRLASGYEASRDLCKRTAKALKEQQTPNAPRVFARMANSQARMRQEITGIMADIRREVLGYS